MSHELDEALSVGQLERLNYIEYRLSFFGSLGRSDIQDRFEITGPTATRDFKLYKDMYPENIHYCSKRRRYLASESYQPHLELTHEFVNTHIMRDNAVMSPNSSSAIPILELRHQHLPDLKTLAMVTKGIYTGERQSFEYISLSSGRSTREISPLALIDTGVRWHLRAYDYKHNRYTDFVLNRINSMTSLGEPIPVEHALINDRQWNRFIELALVPHPSIKHPEAINKEYKMIDGVLHVEVRAALAGYFLRLWNIDTSKEHVLSPTDCHLWLSNIEALYDVENIAIAPGFNA